MTDKFDMELKEFGIVLSDIQKKQFDRYYELLTEWNTFMNLTAITDYDEVNLKHFTDSLSIAKIVDMNKVNSVIDVGTGAGLPGIPLKIVFPHLRVVLLDSLNKRIKFLNKVIEELRLGDIIAYHGRAEEYARKNEFREQFDLCVSRAVANLSTLSEYCLPFVLITGSFVSYKSGESDIEIKDAENAIKLLGGEISLIDKFSLPYSNLGRSLVNIRKIKHTPSKFPRKAGLPSKDPL